MFRPSPSTGVDLPDDGPGTADPAVRRMFAVLLVGVAIWMTDFVHGLHPLFGALLVVVLASLPRVGVVDFPAVVRDVDFSILFFLGGVFAIGEGLSRTGVAETAASSLLGLAPTKGSLLVGLSVVFVSTIALTFLMEGLAVASVLTPILVTYGANAGLPLEPALMTEAIALNTYFFPYQSAVLVAILAEDIVEASDLIRVAATLSVASTVLLVPLQFAVFHWLY